MLRFFIAAGFSVASFDASAAVRYMVQGMTCAEVRESLDRDGVAILYRQGESGIVLYDRFVGGASFCAPSETAATQGIAVADTDNCRVSKCIEVQRFGN